MATVVNKTPEEMIVEHLENNGQKFSWLAEKVGITSGHLHSVLKGVGFSKRELTERRLTKYNFNLAIRL